MRILVNMPSQHAGMASGVARVAFSVLASLLSDTSHDYILRSPWSRDDLPKALAASRLQLEVTPRPSIMVLDVIRQSLSMPLVSRRLGIDVVLNMDPFGSATGGRRRVTVIHDLYFKTIPDQIGWRAALTTDLIFRAVLAGSDKLICVSNATLADLVRFYPSVADKSIVIHSDSTMRVDLKGVSNTRPVSEPYVLVVGNATSNKNLGRLAEAFIELASRHPMLRLVHIGRDENDVIARIIGNTQIKSRLVRLRDIDDETLAQYYRHAACLCVPSLNEGFCLPVLEAQSMGCPVVCSNRSAPPEIAGHGAITFDPERVSTIVAAIERVLTEPELVERLQKLGLENRQNFSWKKAAQGYAAAFHDSMAV